MRLLISNDDGVESPGILLLAERLMRDGHDVTVVAPSRERSTVGHSLTLHKPLRVQEIKPHIFSVSGSPADCVHLAQNHLLKKTPPDLVISGVNRGANLGADIFYSGTVAAAREAYLAGYNALAVSLCIGFPEKQQDIHWGTAFDFVSEFLKTTAPKLQGHWFLNANAPNIEKSKGVKIANQGRRFYSSEVVENKDPRGRPYYWVGGGPSGYDQTPGTDCTEVAQGYVALTPLKVDTTDLELKAQLQKLSVL